MSDGTDETQEFDAPPAGGAAPPEPPALPTSDAPPADQTAPITVPVAAPVRGVNVGLLFLAVAAGAFLIGIAVASSMREGERGTIVADASVGQAGATLHFEGGELHVPRNALKQTTHIVIRREVYKNRVGVRLPTDTTGVVDSGRLVAYSFAPHDLGFRKPVEIVLRISGDSQNGTIFAAQGNRTTVLGGDVDGDRGTVTLKVRTFRFGVV